MDSAIASSNEFGLKLLQVCRTDTPQKNLFYSPVNIAICLSILQTGAKEKTKKQIEEIMYGDGHCNQEGFRILSRYLQELSGLFTLKTTNILAVDRQYTLLSEFVDNLKLNYSSEIKPLPFLSDSEKSREEINRLIEEATNGKIKEMFVPGSISSDTKLVLANAIYFMGKWKDKFKMMETASCPFYTISEEEVVVDMMLREEGAYKYTYSEDLNAGMLEIPYVGETVSLMILLPSERYGLPHLEKNISVEKLNYLVGELRIKNDVFLQLPKFKMEENISLKDRLFEMGMVEAFSGRANFAGISSKENISISSVLHKTFLHVNEHGTEAATVTGVEYVYYCLPPPPQLRFIVDHPFMLFIRESITGLILFIGSIQSL